MSIQKKNIVLYAKRGKQGRVEEYFASDSVKVNCNEGLGSKLLIKLPFAQPPTQTFSGVRHAFLPHVSNPKDVCVVGYPLLPWTKFFTPIDESLLTSLFTFFLFSIRLKCKQSFAYIGKQHSLLLDFHWLLNCPI